MRSDYEEMVLEGIERGLSLEKISKKYGVPVVVLQQAEKRVKKDRVGKSRKSIVFTKRTLKLLVDVVIIYLIIILLGLIGGMTLV